MDERNNHFDVVIIGAGLSGIGAAYHLKDKCPGKSFAILEGREAMGGTWDLFRYPGIRSDSDMHTLGYNFKPWVEAKAIADGPSIRRYVQETATENGISEHIRFRHLVKAASWSSEDARWTLDVDRVDEGDRIQLTCNFLSLCGGYYSYEKGYTPEFEGMERFEGPIVHPQHWPEDLDHAGKRVVVIGSGATAITLVPAMADSGAQVTMLQRSPTYVASRADQDGIANALRKFLPEKLAYAITRWKNVGLQGLFYRRTRTRPEQIKGWLLALVRRQLPPGYDVATHFTPSYDPWDQRLCLVTNGDLFKGISSGRISVVTDHIEAFTETGLTLKSGKTLEADIIVTATGLNLVVMSGIDFSVDNAAINFADTWSYKGMMYSDVPNLVQTFGYVNASWTLRADLNAEYVCRLLNHMDANGVRQCTPRLREQDENMARRPWIDDFSAGYMKRVMHLFPSQGDHDPWRNTQDYKLDKQMIRHAALEDGALVFSNPVAAAASTGPSSGSDSRAEEAA